MSKSLSAGRRSTRPRPRSRTRRSGVRSIGEQPVEAIGREPHGQGVEAAPTLIALEHCRRAGIKPEPHGIDDHLGERGDVLEPHVEALSGDGMDDMRGVADQRHPFGDEGARHREPERMNPPGTDRCDIAELQAEPTFELGVEFRLGQRRDPSRLVRLLGPDDR